MRDACNCIICINVIPANDAAEATIDICRPEITGMAKGMDVLGLTGHAIEDP